MYYLFHFLEGASGLLVKVLTCNQMVAGSSPTRYRLFFLPMIIVSSTLKNEEVFLTASFGGDVKPSVPGELVNISNFCCSRFLVKPYLLKSLVQKKFYYEQINV